MNSLRTFRVGVALVLAALIGATGCATTEEPSPDWADSAERSWPESEFVGVGMSDVAANEEDDAAAIRRAGVAARRQFADTLQVTCQATVRNFLTGVMTQEGGILEQSFAERVARSVMNESFPETETVHAVVRGDGPTRVFARCSVAVGTVADLVHAEVKRRLLAAGEDAVRQYEWIFEPTDPAETETHLQQALRATRQSMDVPRTPMEYQAGMVDPTDNDGW